MTDDEEPFLIFSYDEKQGNEKALALVCWLSIAALYGVGGPDYLADAPRIYL